MYKLSGDTLFSHMLVIQTPFFLFNQMIDILFIFISIRKVKIKSKFIYKYANNQAAPLDLGFKEVSKHVVLQMITRTDAKPATDIYTIAELFIMIRRKKKFSCWQWLN